MWLAAQPLAVTGLGSTFEMTPANRIDLLVDDLVLVEAKKVERLDVLHQAHAYAYLRLPGKDAALILSVPPVPLWRSVPDQFLNADDTT